MKTYIKNIMCLFISFVTLSSVFVSCREDAKKVVISLDKKPILTINNPKDFSIDLSKDNIANNKLDISWSDADFSTPLGITYSLNVKTSDATKSENITLIGKNKESITYKDFSKVVLEKMQLPSGNTIELELSIVAKPIRQGVGDADNNISLSSDPIKVKVVIPAGLSLIPAGYSFVGNMFEGGKEWDINFHGYKFFRDKESDNVHKYIGKFRENSEFKIVPDEGFDGWNHLIGKKDGKLTWEGGDTNIKDITKTGYYQLVFDAQSFTLDIKPYDISGKKEFNFIGLIGPAVGGWDNDILLDKSPYDDHIWYKENVSISSGDIKIRADKDWKTNWGISTFTYGTAQDGANNFAVAADKAGLYNVYFNDLTGWYIFEKVTK